MRTSLFTAILVLLSTSAAAQPVPAPADPATPSVEPTAAGTTGRPAPARWGLEADLVQPWIPEVHIFSARVTRTLWGEPRAVHGELMVGVYVRPHIDHDIVETIDEYLLSVGYRQYLWRGLHLEAAALGGWAWGEHNKLDGMDYSHPSILVEAQLGYRFDVPALGLYLAPQVGGLVGVSTNIGPRGGKSDAFLEGKLLAGLSF